VTSVQRAETEAAFTCDANGNMIQRTESGGERGYRDYSAKDPIPVLLKRLAKTKLRMQDELKPPTAGDMTQRVEFGVTWTQTFNAENRLASISDGTNTWSFVYDGDGNRVKQVNPDGKVTLYLGGGIHEVRDAAGSPQVLKYYTVAGQRLAMMDGTTTRYLLTDHLGSVVAILDDSGNLVNAQEQRYMPFGTERLTPDITQTDFGYTGQRALAATGLMDYNARFYDAALGRFVQPDILVPDNGTTQGLNKYSYAIDNPVNLIDTAGSCPRPPTNENPVLCIALFISPKFVAMPFATLGGDDRSFAPESNPQSSRGYIWINLATKTFDSHVNQTTYILTNPSKLELTTPEEIPQGPSEENEWNVYWIDDSTFIVDYDLVLGGWLGEWGAPHINGVMNFHINNDGSISYGVRRDGYPWAEGYVYSPDGSVEPLFQDPAVRGNPIDLLAIELDPGILAKVAGIASFGNPPLISSFAGISISSLVRVNSMDLLFAFN
jgi:RHS repeat-associated protein